MIQPSTPNTTSDFCAVHDPGKPGRDRSAALRFVGAGGLLSRCDSPEFGLSQRMPFGRVNVISPTYDAVLKVENCTASGLTVAPVW